MARFLKPLIHNSIKIYWSSSQRVCHNLLSISSFRQLIQVYTHDIAAIEAKSSVSSNSTRLIRHHMTGLQDVCNGRLNHNPAYKFQVDFFIVLLL